MKRDRLASLLTVCIIPAVPALTWAAFAEVAPQSPGAVVVPIDVVALVTAVFAGIGTVGALLVSIFLPIMASRQKRAETAAAAARETLALELAKSQVALNETRLEIMRAQVELERVKDNVVLIERNTNSLTKEIAALSKKEGETIGIAKEKARLAAETVTFEEGRREGAETERASVAASGAPANSDATLQAVSAAAAAAAAIAAPAAAAIAAPPAAAIAAPPAAEIAAPPVVNAVVPPAVEAAVNAAFERDRLQEKK